MPNILKRLPNLVYAWLEQNFSTFSTSKQLAVWIAAIFIGVAVSFAAVMFRELIGFIQVIWLQDRTEHLISAAANIPWYVILLSPAIGGLIVGWLLSRFVELRRTSGVPDVMEAQAKGGRNIRFRPAMWSAFATIISLGSGASAGREGPIVHLGAAISSSIAWRFSLPKWSRKTLLASGAAAAVSASFNAPIAGVLFAHELILGHYSRRSFVPIVISAVGGTLFSRLWFGDAAAFEIPDYQITSFWEFPAFALLGVICAIVSVLFQFSIVGTDYVARNIQIPLWLRPALGGLMIGAIGIFFPHVLGVGYEATDMALKNQLELQLLLGLLVAKTAATAITIASRFGGGVFSPALYLGAMAGGAFGLIASQVFPEMASSNGLYAILGMGAVAAAVLGAPFSTTMIVFELTGGYGLSIALLLAVSISTGINQAIHGHSFFEWQLEMRGLFFKDGPHKYVMRSTYVRDFMVVGDGTTLAANEDGELPSYLLATDSLESALRSFDDGGHATLPVVENHNDLEIVGHATQASALSYFNRQLIATSEEEHRL